MASICVHRSTRTPPDSTPGHIRSRDDFQEFGRPATHSRAGTASPFPAIHLARQSPFHGPPGHIRSRDGINLCPSSDPNPSRQHSRAYRLARWFAGRTPTCHAQPCRPRIPLSCNSSDKAIAILPASRAHPLARWHQFVSIERREPLQTALQGTSARAVICGKAAELPRTAVQALHPPFLQFILHPNRLSTGLQGTSARAMVCRKITDRQPTGNTQPSEPG